MKSHDVPEFAVLGHPNEGKSAVVSTLTEDDSVKVSPIPGETTEARVFPVRVDSREIIRFTDTPGFQRPGDTLDWIRAYTGPQERMVQVFCESHAKDQDFRSECELLGPVARGAGIIFVADGSRPVRSNDLKEMEILRLTGRPRMAVINCKTDQEEYLPAWKNEFSKNFNAVRFFNAHSATYGERLRLLESLKAIHQEGQAALEKVIQAFRQDWDRRNEIVTAIICDLIRQCLGHKVKGRFQEKPLDQAAAVELEQRFQTEIAELEKKAHAKIRRLFKHNIFKLDLPEGSIVKEPLFSRRTFQVLGLRPAQLAAAAAAGGGLLGLKLDLATAGLAMGAFTVLGSALGAGSVLLFGEKAAKAKLIGRPLGGYEIRVGAGSGMGLPFILLHRALLYYSYIINWSHGRRDVPAEGFSLSEEQAAEAKTAWIWSGHRKTICVKFFKAARSGRISGQAGKEMSRMLQEVLLQLSQTG